MSYARDIYAKVGDDSDSFGYRLGEDYIVVFATATDGPKGCIGRRVEVKIEHDDLLRLAGRILDEREARRSKDA